VRSLEGLLEYAFLSIQSLLPSEERGGSGEGRRNGGREKGQGRRIAVRIGY
tara:strand:- start:793 stop:945 length:153 start_codon:yes stop_codon:yes gene_type:complete